MKKVLKFIVFFTTFAFLIYFSGYVRAFNEDKEYCDATIEDEFSEDEILISLNRKYNDRIYTEKDFAEIGCLKVYDLTEDLWQKKKDINRIFKLVVSYKNKGELLSKIYKLEKRKDISCASPNYSFELSSVTLNDSNASEQWGLNKISPYNVWENITTGSSTVNVGVIDTGIDATHPDLKNNIDTYLSVDFSKNLYMKASLIL